MGFFAKLGAGWLRIARAMGETQTFVLLSLLYGLVIGPMALLLRAFGRGDLLELRARDRASFAVPKQMVPTDSERCERQF